jgi:type IV pilus assembly protein PilW
MMRAKANVISWRRQRGFSLIELMVGLTVSLICTIAMMSAFALFERQKRTTTSGDDAQQNGSYSLYELERQIRTAGSGLTQGFNYGLWGCAMTAYTGSTQRIPKAAAAPAPFSTWPGVSPATPVPMRAIPVLITDGGVDGSGNALPDTIAVVGGNPAGTVFKSKVTSTPASTTVVLDNSLGIYAGDYMLATTTVGNCVLGQVSTNTAATNTIGLSAASVPSTGFNGAGYLFDLGAQPNFSLYGVNTTTAQLTTFDMLQLTTGPTAGTVLPVADGIVQIKALYGVDDGASNAAIPGSGTLGDDIIDEWVKAVGGTWSSASILASQTTAAQAVQQIKAIRLVVVARSQLPEKSTDYTGPTQMTLFSDLPAALQSKINLDPQYRYKVYDTTIPIRNAVITRRF